MQEPSLARRPAETIDPRVPIADTLPTGTTDPALVAALAREVGEAREGMAEFDVRAASAGQLAAAAGDISSESWVAAEQALSRLVEQQGITARAAANVDALASQRLLAEKWLSPANQAAIKATQDDIAAITGPQLATIDRLTAQLAR